MLPHTCWQLLPSAHNVGWQQTHSTVSWWNGALSAQFVQNAEKTALDKTGTPKHITASRCAELQRKHSTPDSKGIGNKHRKHFLLDQKDIYNVKNIAMYFTQATNTESCGDWPSFLLTLSVFLVTPCWFMFSLKHEGCVFWSLLENEWRCDALQRMPRHFSPMFSLPKSQVY